LEASITGREDTGAERLHQGQQDDEIEHKLESLLWSCEPLLFEQGRPQREAEEIGQEDRDHHHGVTTP